MVSRAALWRVAALILWKDQMNKKPLAKTAKQKQREMDADMDAEMDAIDSLVAHVQADGEALDRIAALMTGHAWNADTLTAIAAIVRAAGRTIQDCR
jgi:hypothetical protein